MEVLLICIAVATVTLSTASYFHRSRQRAFLTKTLKVDEPLRKRVARELGVDGAVVTGVSVFDVFYHTIMITKLDPHVLQGIDHLHHKQNFESLGDLMDFMKSEIIRSEPGEAAWRSMIHKYKGYTGEDAVADYYRERGHDVVTPDSGTNEGWDHIIDGKLYNVKITDDPSYIREHLDKYPDIDIITNREMADAFHDNPRVIINPDLSSQEAFHNTNATFEEIDKGEVAERLADAGDWFDSIPIITLAINTSKNAYKWHKGDLDMKTAAEHTALDTAAVGAGGWLGSKAGLGLGLALSPVTGGASAIIIPAVTSMVGILIGVFTGKGISGWFKGRHLRRAVKELQDLATNFRDEFLYLYQNVVDAMNSFFESRLMTCDSGRREEGFLKRVVFPSVKTTFYRMASRELKVEHTASHSFYADLRENVQNAEEPSEGGMILFANCQQRGIDMLYEIDPLPEYYAAIEAQLEIIEAEQRKLR